MKKRSEVKRRENKSRGMGERKKSCKEKKDSILWKNKDQTKGRGNETSIKMKHGRLRKKVII